MVKKQKTHLLKEKSRLQQAKIDAEKRILEERRDAEAKVREEQKRARDVKLVGLIAPAVGEDECTEVRIILTRSLR